MMKYTAQQEIAINRGIKMDQGVLKIGGYAGTGKTTIAKEVLRGRPGGMPCAFTGKAASVLNRKGVEGATTIHQLIYRYDEDSNRFYKRGRGELPGRYFYIDEGSMVPVKLWKDVQSYSLPVIVTGDPGQLEPVGDDAKLMHQPDLILDTIHRYDGSVAEFAQYVRVNGEYPPTWSNDKIKIKNKGEYQKPESGVILCGFNKTRIAINKTFVPDQKIKPGVRLIGLKNNWEVGVTNGMLMDVKEINDEMPGNYINANVLLDNGLYKNLLIWTGNLGKEKTVGLEEQKKLHDRAVIVDFGYALTVHKFQGSEDKDVTIIDEQCDIWNPARWRYTAVTRTSENLTIYVD